MSNDLPDKPLHSIVVETSILDHVDILRPLSSDLKEKLMGHVDEIQVEAGEIIFHSGDAAEALYVIVSGGVSVYLTDKDLGLTVELSRLGPGQAFGEMALITGDPRSASVRALVDSYLVKVNRKIFFRLVQAAPQVGLTIAAVLARRLKDVNREAGVSFGTLRNRDWDPTLLQLVPLNIIRRHRMLPIEQEENQVTIATPEPHNRAGLEELRRMMRGLTIKVMAVSQADFDEFMRDHVMKTEKRGMDAAQAMRTAIQQRARLVKYDQITTQEQRSALPPADNRAVSDMVSQILMEGIERDASDVHVEPGRDGVTIRYRIDGRMAVREGRIPVTLLAPLLSRLKVLAGMNITERRLPQDGRISMRVGTDAYDLRAATVATRFGEKMSLRVLDSSKLKSDLGTIILWDRALATIRRLVFKPNGLVLVTGPTGSGKTTTMYATVLERNAPDLSICTVEDPIEYDLTGVTQVQVNDGYGLTFATVMRAFLRQTPDIILVGETRDQATADLTCNAALTGHLVLSSFHTNDALSAIPRLRDMDVEPFVLSSALLGVINQRLVRRVCDNCKSAHAPSHVVLRNLARAGVDLTPGTRLYEGKGCKSCNGEGFKGRIGMYEVLEVGHELRDAIAEDLNTVEMREAAANGTHLTLAQYGRFLLTEGLTVPTEVLRVLPMSEEKEGV